MTLKLAQFRDPLLAIPRDTAKDVTLIGFYPREFYVLDNFAAFQVDWRGCRWATSEHAYQAAKFLDVAPDIAELIFQARSPHEAQMLANIHKASRRTDWAEIKVEIMTDILRHKLEQNPYVKQKLLETLDIPLVEDSPMDSFWGWGPDRRGQNQLGKIWMLLRQELQTAG